MAYLRFAVWLSLLFHDLQLFGVRGAYGQTIPLGFSDDFQNRKEFLSIQFDSKKNSINKRSTDELRSPEVFKFELDDAKEPDKETKKLIQLRSRELQLKDEEIEVVKGTISNRRKRSAQKTKPKLIPFLITDAKEPDIATKELIRKSRAHELSLIKNKESTKLSSSRSKTKNPITGSQIKEPTRRGRPESVDLTTQTKEPLRQGRFKSVTVTTENKEPLRHGRVQSVPLTDNENKGQSKARQTASTTQNRQRSSKKSPRKRTRRFAQLTQPRYIKFELRDVKNPRDIGNTQANQLLYNQQNATNFDSDSSLRETRYHYFFQEAPVKQHFSYPKRHEHKDLVFRVNKMQKYIASGQGLENINTNIEISIPPTVTATAIVENLLSEYPKQVYGQKLCPYGNRVCQLNSAPQLHQQSAHNLVAENEVLPEQPQYYYNSYSQPQENQQFTPIVKPYSAPAIEPQSQQEVAQNIIDSNTLANKNPALKIAFLEPTYGYGNKLHPYTIAKNIQVNPITDQTPVRSFDGEKTQDQDLNKNINNEQNQLNLLKDNQEFQELSALIGKSPTDQVHGLSYLLAKEMQRQKNNKSQRPQDQTSPILFHPKDNMNTSSNSPAVQQQTQVQSYQLVPFRQLRQLNKNAPAIVKPNADSNRVNQEISGLSSNNIEALSPNYNGVGRHNNYSPPKIYPEQKTESEDEYSSKYAFGYRVQDFDTGTDFAHKQNRDNDGVTRGQYHILLPDGRIQNVFYYADDTGFHADFERILNSDVIEMPADRSAFITNNYPTSY